MPILNTFGNSANRAYGFTSGGDSRILLSATPGPSATISTYAGYIVFKFTATGTLNVGSGTPGTADVFVVGGGSTGGTGSTSPVPAFGGNGGVGGSRTQSPGVTITGGSPIPVVVGSTSTDSSFGPVTSSGGTAGGSGGTGGAGIAGTAGSNGPSNDYETGSSQNYGGGGGGGSGARNVPGGAYDPLPGGAGGISGGGAGGAGGYRWTPVPLWGNIYYGQPGVPGTANTGGGGGGGGGSPLSTTPGKLGGTGGSGVVIARFPNTVFRTS